MAKYNESIKPLKAPKALRKKSNWLGSTIIELN
jgi:hypothetical protein